MSWQADRYRRFEKYGSDRKTNKHHCPPRSKGGKEIIVVDTIRHRAYHILFGNAGTLEECVAILKKEWWPNNEAGA